LTISSPLARASATLEDPFFAPVKVAIADVRVSIADAKVSVVLSKIANNLKFTLRIAFPKRVSGYAAGCAEGTE
jgi:hypothetical protein